MQKNIYADATAVIYAIIESINISLSLYVSFAISKKSSENSLGTFDVLQINAHFLMIRRHIISCNQNFYSIVSYTPDIRLRCLYYFVYQ